MVNEVITMSACLVLISFCRLTWFLFIKEISIVRKQYKYEKKPFEQGFYMAIIIVAPIVVEFLAVVTIYRSLVR